MTKNEADEKVDEFTEELTQLAQDRGLTLVYVVSHNVEDGLIQSGIANTTDNIIEDIGFSVASLCQMFYNYLIDQGKDNEEAEKDVFVYAQSGLTIRNKQFIEMLEVLQKKLEYLEMKKESETCKHAIEELTEIFNKERS